MERRKIFKSGAIVLLCRQCGQTHIEEFARISMKGINKYRARITGIHGENCLGLLEVLYLGIEGPDGSEIPFDVSRVNG